MHVVQYLPQSLVRPHVDAVVCHGGAGTSAAALVHGLPLLVLPGLAPSQQAVAARVEAAGLGLRLSWDDAGPQALEQAVRRVVDLPAQEGRVALDELPGPADVVHLLEHAVTSSR